MNVLANPRLNLAFALACSVISLGNPAALAAIQSFSADDITVEAGASVTLDWEVDADESSQVINPTIGDVTGNTTGGVGSVLLNPGPMTTTTYTLSSEGASGQDTATVTVNVGAPPTIRSFAAVLDLENPKLNRILSWDVDGATSLDISPGIGKVPVSGIGYYEMVPAGSVWNYLDDGSDQGNAWAAFEFDDSNWPSGPGELGYGENDEATRVGFGPVAGAKFITTYFRHSFTRSAVDTIEQARIGIRYDDGAIVYLNGTEIGRFYMPEGEIRHTTPALGDVPGDADNYTFAEFSPSLLREGKNVLAVEIHQSRGGSSDMSFDLMLEGRMDGELAVAPTADTIYTLRAANEFGVTTVTAEAVVSRKPFAAYSFDMAPAEDSTGETTVIAGGPVPPVLVVGRVGAGAFEFGGGGELRIAGDFSGLDIGDGAAGLSIGFWLKSDSSTPADAIVLDGGIEFSKEDTVGGSGLSVDFPDDEVLIPGVFDGTWHHILVTAAAGTAQVFLDGRLTVSSPYDDGGFDFPDEWGVGGSVLGSDRLVGSLDDLVVFNRALDSDEALSLATVGATEFFLPSILVFKADDQTVARGSSVAFDWFVVDADRVELNPGEGAVDRSGGTTIMVGETTDVTLVASNAHGSRARKLTVTTGALPEISQFKAWPETVPASGGVANLEWQVSSSTSVSIDRGIGEVGADGSLAVSPVSFSSYLMTAVNDFGHTTARTSVTVIDERAGEPWTLVVIPDTQHYSDNPANAPIFSEITQWIADHREERNIRFVLQVGDIVEHNATAEWDRARASLAILDGEVPYAVTTGNHDLGPGGNASTRVGEFNLPTRFGAGSPYAAQPTMGGFYPDSGDPNYRESSYHTFHANGHDYLVLALEWSPRDGVVAWANRIVAEHPNHRAVLLTHMYLSESSRHWTGGVGIDENNGRDLWQDLVSLHENFFLTVNGHALSLGYLESAGLMGNAVHQMLFNAQGEASGGDGWIRLLEFSADGESVAATTFSPHREALGLSAWRTDPANQFALQLSPFPIVDSDGDLMPDAWESAYGLDPNDPSDTDADPNRNGLSNLMEYALAGRPFSARTNLGEALSVEETVDGRKRITFRRRIPGASQIEYAVEKSSDLQTWRSDPGNGSVFMELSASGNGDASETVVVEDVESSSETVFYRLRISL